MKRQRKYKYLSDLGIAKEDQMDNWIIRMRKKDGRKKVWKKEEKIYGICSPYTWNFDDYYMDFMYIHIKRYYEVSKDVINLNFHHVEYEGVEYSIKEAIEYILDWMEKGYYGVVKEEFNNLQYINTYLSERKKVLHLMAEIVPYLNW